MKMNDPLTESEAQRETIFIDSSKLNQVLEDQERAFHNQQPISIELLIKELTDTPNVELTLEILFNEIRLKTQAGESVTLEEYQSRFPEFAEAIRIQWEVERLLCVESTVGHTSSRVEGPTKLSPNNNKSIGRYELQGLLGVGGFGIVYRAIDPLLRRTVALKILKTGRFSDANEHYRFRNEAEAIARVRHENVLSVHDVGEDNGESFIAVEYCEGGTLDAYLRDHTLNPREAAEFVLQIARGVSAAHEMNIIHRDLKPQNIFLQKRDSKHDRTSAATKKNTTENEHSINRFTPKVSDFGLAKFLDKDDDRTRTGIVIGTPAYMAPEQALGTVGQASPSVDIYALGTILYECLTSKPPFRGVSIAETLEMVKHREPLAVRRQRSTVPVDLEIITSRCLQKEASQRYATVNDLVEDLENHLEDRPIRARPVSLATHLIRWGKRNPIVAGLTTGIFLLLFATVAQQWFTSRQIKKEVREKTLALNERAEALRAKDLALQVAKEKELLAEKRLYAAEMNLAEQAWTAGNPARAMDLLENQRPSPNNVRPDFRGFEWQYLYGLLQQDLVTSFQPDNAPVTDAIFSSDGKYLAWYTSNVLQGSAWFVDLSVPNGKPKGLFENQEIGGIAFSPDGSIIAIANDQEVMFVELSSNDRKDSFKTDFKIKVIAWSPDGKWIAIGGHNGAIRLQRLDGDKEHIDLPPHSLSILSLNFSTDSRQIYASSGYAPNDVLARRYDFMESPLPKPREIEGVSIFDISSDGQQIAGLNWGVIKIVDAQNYDILWEEQITSGSIGCVRFSIDGDRVIRGGLGDRLAEIWDWKDKKLLRRVAHNAAVRAVSFDRQDKYWVTGSDDGVVKLWSNLAANSKHEWQHNPPIRRMNVVDNKLYVSGDFPYEIIGDDNSPNATNEPFEYLYDLSEDEKFALVLRPTTQPDALDTNTKFVPDHPPPGLPETIEIWDVGSVRPRLSFRLPDEKERAWRAAAFSSSGSLLATRQWDGPVRIWNVSNTHPAELFAIDDINCLNLSFSKDDMYLAACCEGSCVKVIEVATGKVLPSFQLSSIGQQWTIAAEFSDDSRYLAAGNGAGVVQVWDVQSGKRIAVLRGHLGEIHSLAFFPNSEILAVGGVGPITIWNVSTSQQLMTIQIPDYKIEQIAIADNGMTLYARSDNGIIRRWKVNKSD